MAGIVPQLSLPCELLLETFAVYKTLNQLLGNGVADAVRVQASTSSEYCCCGATNGCSSVEQPMQSLGTKFGIERLHLQFLTGVSLQSLIWGTTAAAFSQVGELLAAGINFIRPESHSRLQDHGGRLMILISIAAVAPMSAFKHMHSVRSCTNPDSTSSPCHNSVLPCSWVAPSSWMAGNNVPDGASPWISKPTPMPGH